MALKNCQEFWGFIHIRTPEPVVFSIRDRKEILVLFTQFVISYFLFYPNNIDMNVFLWFELLIFLNFHIPRPNLRIALVGFMQEFRMTMEIRKI